jgi:hypothetical protein
MYRGASSPESMSPSPISSLAAQPRTEVNPRQGCHEIAKKSSKIVPSGATCESDCIPGHYARPSCSPAVDYPQTIVQGKLSYASRRFAHRMPDGTPATALRNVAHLTLGRFALTVGHTGVPQPVLCELAQPASFTSVESVVCEPRGITPCEPPGHLSDNSRGDKRVSRLSPGTSDASKTQSMLIRRT